ncbi:MAG: Holliday junction branch migration protein RuvA [Planctomycetota bacterium]
MYEYLHGRVEELRLGAAVLDVRDVGYCLVVSAPTSAALETGQEVKLLTHLAVSETSQVLFGFLHQAERALFRRLVQVNGIGPASAIGLLSSLPPEDMVRAILDGDHKKLTAMKGVGKKTAERLIVELRDHLGDLLPSKSGGSTAAPTPSTADPVSSDLERVLLELGTPPAAASRGAEAAIDHLGTEADFQELLRYALSSNS